MLYLVLGEKTNGMFNEDEVEFWFITYIDMLRRLNLHNEANTVTLLFNCLSLYLNDSNATELIYLDCESMSVEVGAFPESGLDRVLLELHGLFSGFESKGGVVLRPLPFHALPVLGLSKYCQRRLCLVPRVWPWRSL